MLSRKEDKFLMCASLHHPHHGPGRWAPSHFTVGNDEGHTGQLPHPQPAGKGLGHGPCWATCRLHSFQILVPGESCDKTPSVDPRVLLCCLLNPGFFLAAFWLHPSLLHGPPPLSSREPTRDPQRPRGGGPGSPPRWVV